IIQSLNNIRHFKERLSEEQKDVLFQMIARNALLLHQLVEDLLVISRIDEKRIKLRWERYNPSLTLKQVLEELEPKREAKNVTVIVNVDESMSLLGDEKKIAQVFRILLDNAIKYSDSNTTVTVESQNHYKGEYNPEGTDGVIFKFIDKGRGIKTEDTPYIFKRFYRSNTVRDIPGTGLGLAIAKELVELHDGKIGFKSEEAKGTTFFVFLPNMEAPRN
ncbi:MAG: sensor histidine kinase, partial [Candidatus Ranarchaeia archaeon]